MGDLFTVDTSSNADATERKAAGRFGYIGIVFEFVLAHAGSSFRFVLNSDKSRCKYNIDFLSIRIVYYLHQKYNRVIVNCCIFDKKMNFLS